MCHALSNTVIYSIGEIVGNLKVKCGLDTKSIATSSVKYVFKHRTCEVFFLLSSSVMAVLFSTIPMANKVLKKYVETAVSG